MRISTPSYLVAAVAVCAAVLAGCPRQGEGPAERVGKTVDKGAAAVGHGIEKTGDAIERTAEGR
ncbi:MAG: hypothetical protein ABR587_06855 [Candidatus Binatia bacterium]